MTVDPSGITTGSGPSGVGARSSNALFESFAFSASLRSLYSGILFSGLAAGVVTGVELLPVLPVGLVASIARPPGGVRLVVGGCTTPLEGDRPVETVD